MKHELSGWEYWKAVIAKWLVVNVASRISPLAVTALCLEVADMYYSTYEAQENEEYND